MTRYALVSLALAVGLTAFGACSDPATEREEQLAELRGQRRALVMQFSSVQHAIRRVQARALEEPGVRDAQNAFNEAVRDVVLRDDPESVELLDRARTVGHDLQAMATPLLLQQGEEDPRPRSPEERAAVAAELAEVERQLRPVINRAFEDPRVAEAFSILQDSVIQTMLRIDPGAQRSLDAMAELEGKVADLDAQIERLSTP